MTIAPADPAAVAASAAAESEAAAQDGPGTALLRTLTDLTADLPDTDPGRVAAAALRGRSARADEAELRSLATEAAAGLISEDPAYSRLAARLLTLAIADEAAGQGAVSFSASVAVGHREGLIADRTAAFVAAHAAALDVLVERSLADGADDRFGYFGLRTLHSRYLLRHPHTRQVIETPQHFMLRVAAGLAEDESQRAVDEVAALYGLMSRLRLPALLPHALQLRHPAPADVLLLPAGLPAGRARLDLRPLPPGGAALEARGRHRSVVLPYPFPRFADPGHQRALQRHRAVPEDARRLRRRGQPGGPPQGRRRRLPGDLARGHRGVPGAARQHR